MKSTPPQQQNLTDNATAVSPSRETVTANSDVVDIQKMLNTITEQTTVIEKKSEVIDAQKKRITMLEEYLRLERARHYGRCSEKSPAQSSLFNEAELGACEDDDSYGHEVEPDTKKKKSNGGRKPLSKNIPREQVQLDLSDEEKEGAVDTFYSKVKEELDIIPAKYCDGLPLYRLEKILERYGGTITRTTLANWMIRLSLQLQPLINLMREHQLSGDYLQMDETTVQVLKEVGRSATSKKYMWVTLGGLPEKPAVIFEYDPSRSEEVPLHLLEGFSGYLQTGGYAGYDAVCKKQKLIRLGCMDHARRYYVDAQKAIPKKKRNNKKNKVNIALKKIGQLYVIEREIKEFTPEQRYQERQKQSLPLLNEFKAWFDENIGKVDKDSLT